MSQFTQGSGEGGWGAARADLAGWAVQRLGGEPGDLHRAGIPAPARRLLRWCRVDRNALVLGSAEPADHVDTAAVAASGLPVARRRSGGSSVMVGPARLVWLDVVVPAGDALWVEDVGVAPVWLGRCWARALGDLGVAGATVHEGPMVRSPWSPYVCFAGVAAGEVTTGDGKVVGICQRRTREAALFQSAALLRWDADEAVSALAIDRTRAAADLAGAAVGIDTLLRRPVDPADVEAAFEQAVTTV